MANKFPENFITLFEEEKSIREQNIKAIIGSEDLAWHIKVIEIAMNYIYYHFDTFETADEDLLTIQFFAARLFNSISCSKNLLLAGYYQSSIALIRDVMETSCLLEYFLMDKTQISIWRTSGTKSRKENFQPVKVREALEKNGTKGGGRRELYKILSELGSHPTFSGFRMLRPDANAGLKIGPFVSLGNMKAVLEELVKLAMYSAHVLGAFFENRNQKDASMKLGFMEEINKWGMRFFKTSFLEEEELGKIKELLQVLPQA